MRWPDGFVCPACGHEKGWALLRKAHTFECAGYLGDGRDDLHASKLPLTVWFWAAYLMATHSNGMQLQKQLGIGSYRSAWLLAHKLRASMVDPERNRAWWKSTRPAFHSGPKTILPPEGKDAATTADAHRRRHRTRGRKHPGRLRLAEISLLRRRRPRTLPKPPPIRRRENRRLVRYAASRRSPQCPCRREDPPLHLVLPWIHQIFSNLKGWARGVYHASQALPGYLDEFVFRFNRRKTRRCFPLALPPRHQCRTLTYSM